VTGDDFWRRDADGIELFVRLTPKSSRDLIEGVDKEGGGGSDGRSRLRVRVRAIPEDGKANKALVKLVGKAFGVPASSVSVIAGHTARLKTLRIAGATTDIEERLQVFGGSVPASAGKN